MIKVSPDNYKKILLDMLYHVDQQCRNHNVIYSLAYGTLLGAIRHNGFIPWDDDVDIVLLRNDYNSLRHIINSDSSPYKFIDFSVSPTIYPYGKIVDTRTVLKEKNFIEVKDYGAFIDVFPLDYLPDEEKKRRKYCNKYRKKMIILTHSSRTGFEKGSNYITTLLRWSAFQIGHLFNPYKLVNNMNRDFVHSDAKVTNHVGIPWGWGGLSYEPNLFLDVIDHQFEKKYFYVPKEYDYILKSRYGDYMTLPPVSERIPLHQLECYYKYGE